MAAMTRAADNATQARFHSTVLPWLVLLIGIPTAFVLFAVFQDSVTRVAQLRFDREANTAHGVVENRLHSYTHVLYALRALFASDETVDRLEFNRFVESLDIKRRYPGFMSLNYAAYVPAKDKERFEAMVRADSSINPGGYPNFSIKPPGERSEYFVLTYLEPMAGYEFAFGLDLAANSMAKHPEKVAKAVRLHRDSGDLSASAQPLRVKREKEVIYLAMRLGVYRKGMPVDTVAQRRDAYIGSVGAAFEVESLIAAALNKETLRYMRLKLYDAGPRSNQRDSEVAEERVLLFDSGSSADHSAPDGSTTTFVYKDQMDIAGRNWEVEYSAPRNAIINDMDKLLPLVVLGGGLVTSLLIFGMVYILATSRSRAIVIANDITQVLRESESSLAEAQQMAHLGNWTIDTTTWNMTLSAEIYQIFGQQPRATTVTFAEFLQKISDDDRMAVDQALRHSIEAREDCDIEHRICPTDGNVRWVHTIAHPTRANRLGLVPGTMMDITDRKCAELELKSSHEQLQSLSRSLVDIQEAERRRFSTELHDVVGQNLTALSINLDIIKTQYSDDTNQRLRMRLNDSAALLRSTTAAIENVMSELRPPMLDDYGLIPALQWYARQFSSRTGVHVEVHGDEQVERLTPVAEIALFRIAQEALNNVAKHARATCVDIRLERRNLQYVVSVADDGMGFDAALLATALRRPGLGMITMRERIQAIGGTLEVEGARGHGTRIVLRVPC
jgi:PAS domain S-box-containing protein